MMRNWHRWFPTWVGWFETRIMLVSVGLALGLGAGRTISSGFDLTVLWILLYPFPCFALLMFMCRQEERLLMERMGKELMRQRHLALIQGEDPPTRLGHRVYGFEVVVVEEGQDEPQ